MNINRQIYSTIIWSLALITFIAGLYFTINRISYIFAPHNYLLAPLGDDGVDAGWILYPELLIRKKIRFLFHYYGDHRLVLARLQALFEYYFTKGTQVLQPFRLAGVLLLDGLIFAVTILFSHKRFTLPVQLILIGLFLTLFFAGITIPNYGSTYMVTWPIIFLEALLIFYLVDRYCSACETNPSHSYRYLWLTFAMVNVSLYTFSSGMLFWPIIFLVLIKRKCFMVRPVSWLCVMMLTYLLYFLGGWNGGQLGPSIILFLAHPVNMLYYLSRIVTSPFILQSITTQSTNILICGMTIMSITAIFLVSFLCIKKWRMAETMLFSIICFSALSVVMIAIGRFGSPREYLSVGRFTTPSFILLLGLATSGFYFIANYSKRQYLYNIALSSFISMLLLFVFIPHDLEVSGEIGVYDQGQVNQFLIAETLNVPIDEIFAKGLAKLQNQRNIKELNLMNAIQKQGRKGAYSLWPVQLVGQSFARQDYKVLSNDQPAADISINHFLDNHASVFINIVLPNYQSPLTSNWYVLFVDSEHKVVGYGVSSPYGASLWNQFIHHIPVALFWRGAVNKNLIKTIDKPLQVWAVNSKSNEIIKLGQIAL